DAGRLAHGYATTIHKAQGVTVDRCLVLLDETVSREHAYTALSRGRHGNDIYMQGDSYREEGHAAEIKPNVGDVVRTVMNRSITQQFAIDQIDRGASSSIDEM